MEPLIAYCGVDCSECTDYKNGVCPSCRLSAWQEDDLCMPAACCQKRGIEFCGRCADFPRVEMAGFYEESASHRKAYERMMNMRRQ